MERQIPLINLEHENERESLFFFFFRLFDHGFITVILILSVLQLFPHYLYDSIVYRY